MATKSEEEKLRIEDALRDVDRELRNVGADMEHLLRCGSCTAYQLIDLEQGFRDVQSMATMLGDFLARQRAKL